MVEMKPVKAKLREIFDYYGSTSNSLAIKYVKGGKFKKMAAEAGVFDENKCLPRNIDILFTRLTKQTALGMTLDEFHDAILQMAVWKYPRVSPKEAVASFYEHYLLSFQNPKTAFDEMIEIDEDWLEYVKDHATELRGLYVYHFSEEINPHFQRPAASQQLESQKKFGEMLTLYGVIPEYLSKAIVYHIYRDSLSKPLPPALAKIRHSVPDSGSVFTFWRWLVGLLRIARRLSPVLMVSGETDSDGQIFSAFLSRRTRGENLPPEFSKTEAPQKPPVSQMVHDIFVHYTKLSDPLNIKNLSSFKFGRILKEGGIWATLPDECLGRRGFVSRSDADLIFRQVAENSHHVTLRQFDDALRLLAPKVLPALIKRGFVQHGGEAPDAWVALQKCMLEPLSLALGLGAAPASTDEVSEILNSVSLGLSLVFKKFGDHPIKPGFMSLVDFTNFFTSFEIGKYVPPIVGQKIFSEIGKGRHIDFQGFERAIVLLADRAVPGLQSPQEKLSLFLERLNHSAAAFAVSANAERLFPVSALRPAAEAPRFSWKEIIG